MNSKGLREFAAVQQREFLTTEERLILVQPGDIELRMGNSQSLNIRVSKAAGYRVHDIVKLVAKKAGSRLVVAGRINEIQDPTEDMMGKYVNIVVEPAGDFEKPFPPAFMKELGQGVYLEPHRVTPEERQLHIELGMGRAIPPSANLLAPYPADDRFSGVLDANKDGLIEKEEAREFAAGAINWIRGEGLTFKELARGIPDLLKVNDILQMNPAPRVYTGRIFNGVPLQVRRQEQEIEQVWKEWIDILADQLQFTGTEFDSVTGNVAEVDLKEGLEVARIEFKDSFRPGILPIQTTGDAELAGAQWPWPEPTCYISAIDKKEGGLLMSRREVETIKKIKKCGKCFYRIVLTDDGVVSGIRSGNYRDCIIKITMLQPPEEDRLGYGEE